MSETAIQTNVRILASEKGALTLRYQVGTFLTLDGRHVKVGEEGVSDLIGLIPHTITAEDVGKTVGIFTAWEMKKPGGRTEKEREKKQGNFMRRVNALGGIAGIVLSEEHAEDILTHKWDSKHVKKYTP